MACVMRSAYDILPQALRRVVDFLLDAAIPESDTSDGVPIGAAELVPPHGTGDEILQFKLIYNVKVKKA